MKSVSRKSRLVSRIAAACVVAVGIASVWFVLAMWVGSLVTSVLFPHKNLYETVAVAFDGTPIIDTYSDFFSQAGELWMESHVHWALRSG